MARPFSPRVWFSQNTGTGIGALFSGMFLLVGGFGCLAFGPTLIRWFDAADWPTTTAEIIDSNRATLIQSLQARPEFTYRYTWKGELHTAHGFDLFEVYSN